MAAGDVYAEPPHVGRGGWTWYSGFSRLALPCGSRNGFSASASVARRFPSILVSPGNWPSYSIKFRYHSATYQIKVDNPSGVSRGVASVSLDGKMLTVRQSIPIADDGATHQVVVVLGQPGD